MIQISLTHALIFYSLILGVVALGIWLYTEIRTQYRYKVLEKQHLWRCTICAFVYLDEDTKGLSRCPRCDSLVAVDDKGAREVKEGAGERAPLERPGEKPRKNPSRGKRPAGRSRGGRRRR